MERDELLAARARRGDRASFDRLVDRHARRLFGFACARLGHTHDAEEAVQEALLKVWSARRRYDPGRPFIAWLLAITNREAINILRRRAQGPGPAGSAGDLPAAPHPPPGPAGVWDLAARLLDREIYTALYLRYASDLAPSEIATILGRPPTWVRVALHRARATLAQAMTDDEAAGPTAPPAPPSVVAAFSDRAAARHP